VLAKEEEEATSIIIDRSPVFFDYANTFNDVSQTELLAA
jgi:hypothetical protein